METIFAKLDSDQKEAVRLRANGTVSAGAGSGKTTVLAARYLALVLGKGAEIEGDLGEGGSSSVDEGGSGSMSEGAGARSAEGGLADIMGAGADVRSILCLTFTRKAAAEMKARIWRELSKSGSPRAKEALERFSEATITTIDSFCGSILRSSAQRYGFAPDFRVDDVEAQALAIDEALRFVLARREDPALREVLAYQSFMTVWKELFGGAGHRFSTPASEGGGELAAVPARARKALIRMTREALAQIEESRGEAAELGDLGTKSGKDFIAALGGLPADMAPPVDAGGSDEEFAQALGEAARATSALAAIGMGFGKRDEGPKDHLKAAAGAAREAARQIASASEAASHRGFENRIIALVDEFAHLVAAAKRGAGLMSFHDVIVATVDLLAVEPKIRAWWKSRFRWIMVDEFQDDDELQKKLFFLLAEKEGFEGPGIPDAAALAPDKLFFVGDDKQSIYRFRGADVTVFNRLGRELATERRRVGAAAPPQPRLRTNYRSEPGLIDFYNSVFSRLLAEEGAPDYEARFERTLARNPTPGVEPGVTLLLKVKGGKSDDMTRSDDEALAEGIALHIGEIVASKRRLVPDGKGGARPATFDDIAILLRSSSKQYLIERFLRLHGIAHRAAAVRSLFVESPANDLLALLGLSLVPGDRLALATVLRSPFARLSEGGFVAVLADERGLDAPDSGLDLSAKDRARLDSLRSLLDGLAERVDRLPLARLLSWLWYDRGLRLSILADPSAHPFLEHFDWLFALAVAADGRGEGLAAFLDRLRPLLGTAERLEEDIEAPRETKGGVQIMTIHKSKGLEFPIVILPWIENRGRSDQKGPAWYESAEVGLTLNLRDWRDPKAKPRNLFYEEANGREKAQSLAEMKRLFYVACTRASTRLIFAGIMPVKKAAATSFFQFLGARVEEPGAAATDSTGRPTIVGLPEGVEIVQLDDLGEEAYRALASKRGAPSVADFEKLYAQAETLDRSRPGRLVPATALAFAAWEADPRREGPSPPLPASAYDAYADQVPENRFGDLCHAVLEARLKGRPLDPAHASLLALPDPTRGPLLAEAERLADGFFSSPGANRLALADEILIEKPILLAVGDYVVRARLDLVLVGGSSVLVLDWKSGKEGKAAAYSVQLALYRRALAALYPGKEIRSALWWLRSASEEELSEEYDEAELATFAATAAGALASPASRPEAFDVALSVFGNG